MAIIDPKKLQELFDDTPGVSKTAIRLLTARNERPPAAGSGHGAPGKPEPKVDEL